MALNSHGNFGGRNAMSITPASRLQRELTPDEHLLWSGAPAQGVRLRGGDIFMIPFSLLWGGFAFFWEGGVLTSLGARFTSTYPFIQIQLATVSFMALWGIPFCLMGIYVIIGRFFVDAWMRGRTVYGVTDHRVIIAQGGSVKSLPLATLPQIELREGRSGRGSLYFGEPSFFDVAGWPRWGYRGGNTTVPSFEGIAKAREVYTLILGASRKASKN